MKRLKILKELCVPPGDLLRHHNLVMDYILLHNFFSIVISISFIAHTV